MNSKTIIIERTFNAPIQKVWNAWTDAGEIKKWWGPKDFTAPSVTIDFRAGGRYLNCMRGAVSPDSPPQDFWSGGEYKEIIPLQKIVSSDYFTDAQGNKISPKEVGMPGEWPDEMDVTVTFEDLGDETKITLVHEGHPEEIYEMALMGWNQTLDKFAESL